VGVVGSSSSSSLVGEREKGCGFLSLQISPILITVGPGFLQQKKRDFGFGIKEDNQSINPSINQSIV